ncbi:Hpt domain-containing protein [Oligoflexus tunisiensis]|uniref:Hpt domain-containing protein n=1 Tax=Oligoflexus tunisiensis TaxID=708132 RepID=UPI00114CC8BF|nr:Hpt domain-containing protein [Oligoflexus tunisiensis]
MSAKNFDLQPLLEAVSDDPDIMSQVIQMFIQSTRENLEAIREAIQNHDAKAVKCSAHHLKGSLLEFSAQKAVALSLQLEKLGATEQLAAADGVWRELDAEIRDLVAELQQTEYLRSA